MASAPEQTAANRQFGGVNRKYKYRSDSLGCDTTFTIYFPPGAEAGAGGSKVPVMYWLSGLTCTDDNFIQKSGAQRAAAAHGIALVAPDTSPRGLGVAGEAESWDFGVGAGFYLNATQEKWRQNWRMYDFIMTELPAVLQEHFGGQLDLGRAAISGHSMGGHGAIMMALRNPERFASVSAFSPICHPSVVPWGIKAFTGYLGEDPAAWAQYDSTLLMRGYPKDAKRLPLLVDTGSADSFLAVQLQPGALQEAAEQAHYPATFRMQEGYDHSYFFISTFIDDHIAFHAKALGLAP